MDDKQPTPPTSERVTIAIDERGLIPADPKTAFAMGEAFGYRAAVNDLMYAGVMLASVLVAGLIVKRQFRD